MATNSESNQSTSPGRSAIAQIYRTQHKLQKALEAELTAHEVTQPQFEILTRLYDIPGQLQQEIAEGLNVTKGNVTAMVDRLASRGLVERRPDPVDRRVNCLYLTKAGETAVDEIVPTYSQMAEKILSVLNPEEQQTLTSLLSRIEQALK